MNDRTPAERNARATVNAYLASFARVCDWLHVLTLACCDYLPEAISELIYLSDQRWNEGEPDID
jgi:hypothetical protein